MLMSHWTAIMLMPILHLVFSIYLYKINFTSSNYIFGYKTPKSLKNEKTFRYANKFAQRLQLILSILNLILAVTIGIFINETIKAFTLGSIILALLSIMIIPITEMFLSLIFDKNGNSNLN